MNSSHPDILETVLLSIMNPAPKYNMVPGLPNFSEYKWRDKILKVSNLQTPLKTELNRGEVSNSKSEGRKDQGPDL